MILAVHALFLAILADPFSNGIAHYAAGGVLVGLGVAIISLAFAPVRVHAHTRVRNRQYN